jgi:cell division transport system permease protein
MSKQNRSQLFKDIPLHEREPLSEIWKATSNSTVSTFNENLLEVFSSVILRLKKSFVTTLFSVATSVIALTILGLVSIVLVKIQQQIMHQTSSKHLSIYIKDGTTDDVIKKLLEAVKSSHTVTDVKLISKSQAINEFKSIVGENSPLLVGIEDKNPLPASLEVSFTTQSLESGDYKRIFNEFEGNVHVESLVSHSGSLSDVGAILQTVRTSSLLLFLCISIISAFLIFCSVRLSIYNYLDEIEIMSLVGASDQYIKKPFVLEGVLIGVIGAFIASIIGYTSVYFLNNYFSNSALASYFGFQQLNFPLLNILFLFIYAAIVGGVSSYIATRGTLTKL